MNLNESTLKISSDSRPADVQTAQGHGRLFGTAALAPAAQCQLARRARLGCTNSRNLLIESNMRLVATIAHGFSGRGLPFDDLVSEGTLGLIAAIEHFDPERGVFSVFAATVIRRAMQLALGEASSLIRVPHKKRRQIAKWRRAGEQALTANGLKARPESLAEELGITLRAALDLERTQAVIAHANTQSSGESDTARALIDCECSDDGEPAPSSVSLQQEEISRLCRAVERLSPRMGTIVRLRFGLATGVPLSVVAIAEQFGTTVPRVHYQLRSALETLRRQLHVQKAA